MCDHIESTVLDWDASSSTWPPANSFDVILASDILYDDKHVPAVLRLICHLIKRQSSSLVLISDAGRYPIGPLLSQLRSYTSPYFYVEQIKSEFTLNEQRNDIEMIVACERDSVERLTREIESVRGAMKQLANASPFLI